MNEPIQGVVNEIDDEKRFIICEYQDLAESSIDIDLETTDDIDYVFRRLKELSGSILVRVFDRKQEEYLYP